MDGIIRKEKLFGYSFLKQHFRTSTRKLKPGHKWVLQIKYGSKHAFIVITKWIEDSSQRVRSGHHKARTEKNISEQN